MATKNPFTIDGTSQLGFNWKASSVEFTDGEDLQTKFDNKTIVPEQNQIKLYSSTGSALDGSMTQKSITAQIEALRSSLTAIQDSLNDVTSALSLATPPVQSEPLTYTGSVQNANLTYDPAAMVVTGTLTGTAVSSDYQWIATLKDGYQWTDGTTAAKSGKWSIVAADYVTFQANKANVALTSNYPSDEIKYTTNSDGMLEVTSKDTTIATVNVDSTSRKVTITGVATGTTSIDAKIAKSTNYSASSIITTPISVQFENSIGLLWDSPLGTGKGWVRVSGRSTASNIIEITDANYNPDNTWPFNKMEAITVSGYMGVKIPILYHRYIQIEPGRILYFIESEQTSQNVPFHSFQKSASVTYPYLFIRSNTESTISRSNLIAKTQGTVYDIWDHHLILRLMLMDLNPGKSADTKITNGMSWRGISNVIPSGTARYWAPGFSITSGNYFKISSPYHLYADSNRKTVESLSSSRGSFYMDGNWALANASGADLSQIFTQLSNTTTVRSSSSAAQTGVAHADFYINYSNGNYYYTIVSKTTATSRDSWVTQSPYSAFCLTDQSIDEKDSPHKYSWRARQWLDS